MKHVQDWFDEINSISFPWSFSQSNEPNEQTCDMFKKGLQLIKTAFL